VTKAVAALFAIGVCTSASPAGAATKTHPVGLSVTYPDDWKTKADGDTLTLQSSDEAVAVLCLLFDVPDLETAKAQLDAQLRRLITDLKIVAPPREITVNGLRGITAMGTGQVGGTPANWEVSLFVYQRKTLMLVALADSGKYGFYVAQIAGIFQGVKITGEPAEASNPAPAPTPASAKKSAPAKRAKRR
jgi:hypothetical protein